MARAYCANATSTATAVDANTGAVLANITPLSAQTWETAVSPDGTLCAISQTAAGTVEFITTATNALSTGYLLGSGFRSPAAMAWAWDSSKVYVYGEDSAGHGVAQSITPAGVLGPVWTVTPPSTTAGGGIALSGDGHKLYCVAFTGTTTGSVVEWDIPSTSVTATYTLPGVATSGLVGLICVSPDGRSLYVTNADQFSGLLYKVDLTTGTTSSVTTGSRPLGVCISPDGSTVWVAEQASGGSGQVETLDTATFTLTHQIPVVSATEIAMNPDGSSVVVGMKASNGIVTIDTATRTPGTPSTLASGGATNGVSMPRLQPAPPPTPGSGITSTVGIGPLAVTSGGTVSGTPTGGGTVTGSAVLNVGPLVVAVASTLETITGTAAVRLGPLVVVAVSGRVGPGLHPVPGFRGRWRLTLHQRAFAPATLASTIIAELSDARGRQLVQAWNTPATLTFTLDGHAQSAALVHELLHDVVAWRWDDQTGLEQPVFRGVITQSEDQLDEQSHTVTYTCHDYAGLLARRLLTATYSVVGRDQDLVVADLLAASTSASTSSGTALTPASYLPLSLQTVTGSGSLRGLSGQLRDRTYYGSQNVATAVSDLAAVDGGYDYDVRPSAVDTSDSLRVFYPQQGVTRADIALQYGSTVASLTRTTDSSTYANYVRVLGNNQSANPTPQLFAEYWDPTAILVGATPVGLWMTDDAASDVTVIHTLQEKAHGDINYDAILDPAYTLNMAPNAYAWGAPNMGDVVPLIVNSGRLNVNSTVRVLGITYLIGDDGQEDVTLAVTRPQTSLAKLFNNADRDVKALARR